jgi:CheY-like chemotaxis protein
MPNAQKILVAQSDLKRACALRSAFEQRGWDVMIATDTVQAFTVAIRNKPAAVLLSSQIKGGGGLFLLKRMRECVHTAPMSIIVITEPNETTKQEYLSAGALECIEQPVEIERLCAAVRNHVAQPRRVVEPPLETLSSPARLAAIRDTQLLDSPPTQSFDELTRLATSLLGTPVALVSIVTSDKQFFKSQVGLADPWAKSRQTPLSHSFCQWVVSSRDELIVADARQHEGLIPNLALRDLGVVAYAGVPLSASSGQVLGSFCAIDSKPHRWTDDDLATLRDLSKIAEAYTALEASLNVKPEAGRAATSGASLLASTDTIGRAIRGATRILQRGGEKMSETDRALLLQIVKRLNQELSRPAGGSA